ncbi:MAG: hypothetical protein Q8R02_20650 [Hyphomonadaceae bacterium]|nr:hypothetical protein [Hyphomonadaceae bacterium]
MIGIESVTREVSKLALDGLWLRQQLIAQNVANQQTAGFRPLRLEFESVLQNLSQQLSSDGSGELSPESIAEAREQIAVYQDTGAVQIDQEMADSTMNGVRYQALLTALGKLSALNRVAISGGSR